MMNNKEKKKLKEALNFVEELSWLVESKKNIDLKEVPKILDSIINSNLDTNVSNKYLSPNHNKNVLVGILPSLFQDKDLFQTNLDLVDFSEKILNIEISRGDKRSRYELIGLIVTEINSLNDNELSRVVEALSIITKNKNKLNELKKDKKKDNFSWNEAIQKLSRSY